MEYHSERENPGYRSGYAVSQNREVQPEEGEVATLHLLSLGETDVELLSHLRVGLTKSGFIVVQSDAGLTIEPTYDVRRGQYNSTRLLTNLRNLFSGRNTTSDKFLAIIQHDLFVPVLTFVFGEAELAGTYAVVSYHRLENERYGLKPDRSLLVDRLLKESIHEVGHLFGLKHCHSPSCVMRTSTSVEEIDNKGADFCSLCARGLEDESAATKLAH